MSALTDEWSSLLLCSHGETSRIVHLCSACLWTLRYSTSVCGCSFGIHKRPEDDPMASWDSVFSWWQSLSQHCRDFLKCCGGTIFNQCELPWAFWKQDVTTVPIVWHHSGNNDFVFSRMRSLLQWKLCFGCPSIASLIWPVPSQFEDWPVALSRIAWVFSVQMFILIVRVCLVLLMHCNIRCFEISGVRRLILECCKGRWYFKV